MRYRDSITALLGLSALTASVFLIGGAWRWTQAVVAGLVLLALLLNVRSRRYLERCSPLLGIIGVATVLTALQLVPLPGGVLDTINPTGHGLREEGTSLVGVSSWSSISLDPAGTLRSLAFLVILFGIAVLALRIAASDRGRYRILAGVTALCGVTAGTVWIHDLVGARSVFGIYDPEYARPHLIGPLLNLNHLACLMAVGTVMAIALVFYPRQPSWLRVGWAIVIAACGSLTVATVSRGATIALGVAVLVVLGILIAQRLTGHEHRPRSGGAFLTRSLPIAVVAACAIVVAIYTSAGGVQRELGRLSFEEVERPRTKFAAWKASTALIQETPWAGVGRGAFEPSFTHVYPDGGFSTFSHAENAYLQAVIDWGIPGALIVALAVGWFWLVALRRWSEGPLSAAALGALSVIAIQSTVDFGIEMLAIAAPATAIAATLVRVPLIEDPRRDVTKTRVLRGGVLASLALAALVLLIPATTTVAEDHKNIGDAPSMQEIRASIERHPLDYLGYAQAARLTATDASVAVPLLNHALRLHPWHPGLHHVAARLLLRDGHESQAAVEYSAAIRFGGNAKELVPEIAKRLSATHAVAAIPVEYRDRAGMVQLLEELERRDLAMLWLLRVRARGARTDAVCDSLFAIALRTSNLAVLPDIERVCATVERDPVVRSGLAQLALSRTAYADVIRIVGDIESWTGHVEAKSRAWLATCDAHWRLKAWSTAQSCLRRLDASGLSQSSGEIAVRLEQIGREQRAAGSAAP